MKHLLLLAVFIMTSARCGSPQDTRSPFGENEYDQDQDHNLASASGSAAVDNGMIVQADYGTLRRDQVDPVMNEAVNHFMNCYAQALGEQPFLIGDLALHFTIATDGSVRTVRTTSATLGSRQVEQCILSDARHLRFPRPLGGEAEFDYGPIVFNPGDGTRQPDLWSAEQVSEQLQEHQERLYECTNGASGFTATLYIGPDGRVSSSGVVAPSLEHESAARCLEEAFAEWQLADSDHWVAKLSLEL